MKYRLMLAAIALTATSFPAGASDTANQSPFIGSWALDLSRMPVTYGTPPKSVTYSFSANENDDWETRILIVMADGSERDSKVKFRRDGQAVKGEGDKMEADSAAVNSPAPNVLVMSLAREKDLQSVRVYAVSADGKEMTESAADVDDEGLPFVRNFYYARMPDS